MDKKPRPKYPNRNRVILRRLFSQILFLLLGLGLAVFYLLFNDGGEEQNSGTTLDTPAASVTGRAGDERPRPPPGVLPSGKDATGAAPEKTRPAPPGPDSPAKPAPRQKTPGSAPPGKTGDSGNPPSSAAALYADKSLDELAQALAARFSGRVPSFWGERPSGITTRLALPDDGPPTVALTLDACGGKKGASYDEGLIAFLRERNIPATLFITSLWLRSNPETLRELAADPLFEIAAHGDRHRPCSVSGKSAYGIKGTTGFRELVEEVEGNLRELERATGARPRWYRSGTAHYDDVAAEAVLALGCGIAGYSIAGDEGATLPAAKVVGKTLAARPGDILLYHMNKPKSGTREGLMKALPLLVERGYRFVRLSDIPWRAAYQEPTE